MPQRWFLVGVSYTFVVLGALSIGPFILPVALGATWFSPPGGVRATGGSA